jgi:hypothetical protein
MASGFPSTFFAPDEADSNALTGFTPDTEAGNSATMQDQQSAAAATYNTVDVSQQNLTSALAPFVGAVADLPDLVSSSVGLTNRGDINLAGLNAIGSPGLTSWYNNNRGAIEIGSGISSLVASEFAAARFLKAGSFTMDVLSKVPYAGRVATLDKDYNQAMRVAQLVQTEVSSQAITGAAQYNTTVTLGRLGRPGLELSSNQARRNLVWAGVAKGAVRNVVATGVLAGIANQNSFLFSDDLSENLWAAGAGIALGGLLDSAMTKYAFKKFANSDTLNRVFSRTLDPNATEGARLEANRFTGALPSSRFNPYDQLHDDDTDLATSYALSVAEGRNDSGIIANSKKARIFERKGALATQQEQQLRDTMQKATTGGIAGVNGTAFSMDSAAGKTAARAIHKDATAFYTVSEVGMIPEGSTSAIVASTRSSGINDRLTDLQKAFNADGWAFKKKDGTFGVRSFAKGEKDKLLGEYQRLVYRNSGSEQHMIDSEWVPAQIGRMFDSVKAPEIIKVGDDIWQPKGLMPGKNFGVGVNGRMYLPRGMALETADLSQTLGLYGSANKAIESIIASPEGKFILPKNPHWFQLDMAEEIINRMGNDSKVTFPAGLTRESAMVESFKLKASKALALGLQDADSTEAQMMRYRFNLPRLSAAESGLMGTSEHPIETLFRGAPDRDLSDVNYQDLVKGISDVRQINGMTDLAKDRGDRTLGDMFTFNLGNDGNPLERLVAWKRPFAPFQWVKDDLSERMAMNKAVTRGTLTDQQAGPMSRDLTQKMLASPNFQAALKVDSLQDIQMAPSTPFFGSASPQTTRGAVLNDLTYREMRDRDNPVLLASARAQSDNSRATLAWMQKKIDPIMSDVNDRISAAGAAKSETLLNQFLTFRRGGWEFQRDPKTKTAMIRAITFPDGTAGHTFVLDPKSSANQAAWKEIFGKEMNAAGEVLTAPNGRAIAVDDLAKEWLDKFDFLAKDVNKEKNTLLRARGLGEINSVPFYSPPPNLDGKIVGFTVGPDGNTMRNGGIVADTVEEFNRKLARMRDPANLESPLNTPGATFYRKDEIEQFSNIWDKAQMDWKDPGITAVQPGKTSQGKLSGFEVDPNSRKAAMLWLRDSYVRHGNDVKNYLFDNAIKSATARAAISRESTVDGLGRKTATQNSIYDYWLQNVFGRAQSKTPASPIGSIMNKISDTMNSYLKEINPSQSSIVRAASDFTRTHNPFNSSDSDKQVFEKLKTDLGDYMPFAKISDFMASKYNMKPTAELQAITAKMSQFEATSRLRMFETIQAVMNMSGIVNAMPAVIRSMQKLPGEADADFAQRTGQLGTIFTTPDNKALGIFSMPKLMYETFKDTWNRASHANWDYMVAHGYMTQEAAEFHRQWGVTDTASGFSKFVKGIVDKTSWLSDKSEDFSRSWGHMAGLKLADHLGIPTMEAKQSFAHEIANKMIANYDPLNRPAIFQGALGTPIGLFQSYIMNFYGRMFRYMETGDYRSLATQYAMQAGLFGAGNVPGFNEVNALMFQHGDDHNDPLDGLYKRFGTQAGDWLFGGVISNLPKLVNLLPGEQGVDGVNLYSRGDANVRIPGLATGPKVRIAGKDVNLPSIPMFDTIARVFNAVSTGVGLFSSSNPHKTSQQVAEVLSNMITNRPIAGLIEQTLGGGYDTDASGNVASQTHGAMEAIDRIIGVRSLRESKELQAYYSDMNAKQTQGALMSELSESAKSAVRAGDTDVLPEYFNEYVRRGGDPRRFAQWVNRISKAATTTRAQTMLESLSKSKNPANAELTQRLLDFGVSIQDDEGDGDGEDLTTPYNATDESALPGGVGVPGGGNIMGIPITPNDAVPGFEPQVQ